MYSYTGKKEVTIKRKLEEGIRVGEGKNWEGAASKENSMCEGPVALACGSGMFEEREKRPLPPEPERGNRCHVLGPTDPWGPQ